MQYRANFEMRKNLSEDLADLLRKMIFDGKLTPGERLKEVVLASQLSVSRTPLREALTTLVAEGTLVSLPRRGVVVKELTIREASEVYPIRSLLDPEALRLSGLPSQDQIQRLEKLNSQLRFAKQVTTAINLDDEWHLELYAHCPNSDLITLIKKYMRRTRRYELASMRESHILNTAANSKAKIIEFLRDGNLSLARARLKMSLEDGVKPVIAWLERRDAGRKE